MEPVDRLVSELRDGRITRRQFVRKAGLLGLTASMISLLADSTGWAAASKEIKIGAIYPLSGVFASVAIEFKSAAEMALDFINGVNGVTGKVPFSTQLPLAKGMGIPNLNGAKLRIVFADSQGKPELAQTAADRLIHVDKCVALFGAYSSSSTAPASQVAERYGIPFINPESSSPKLTRRGFKWFVRVQPDSLLFATNFFLFLNDFKKKHPNIKANRVALLHDNSLAGTDAANAQMDAAKKNGFEVVADVAHPTPASQLTSEVEKLKAAKPDILFHTSYFAEVALFLKTAKQLDFNVDAIIGDDNGYVDDAYLKNTGPDGYYIITRAMWADDIAGKKVLAKEISGYYKQKFNIDLTENAGLPFMAVFVLADALNRARTTAPAPLMKAILQTNISVDQNIFPWPIKFDAAQGGQNTLATAVMEQVLNGKYVTIWPFDVAAADVMWPMPKWSTRR